MKKKNLFIVLLLAGAMTACNDKNEELGIPDNPGYPVTHFSKIELSEIRKGDAVPVTTTETYAYNDGRLTSFTYTQRFMSGEPVEMKNISQVVYGDNKAVVTDDFGYVSTYTLNDEGYATSCIYKEGENTRSFTFSYFINAKGRHFLKEVKETMKGNQPYSTITIEYKNNRITHITQQVDIYEQKYTITSSANDEADNTSELPFRFITELYPLTFHTAAIYGKLLGDSYDTLITQLIPDNNSESLETTTYKFKFGTNGIVISCDEVTNSYGEDYIRTVNYTLE